MILKNKLFQDENLQKLIPISFQDDKIKISFKDEKLQTPTYLQ